MDAKQIAALARAGLTDDQIELVERVTVSRVEAQTHAPQPTALAPTEAQAEAAREYNAEAAHAVGKRAYHGRNLKARPMVLDALRHGPKPVESLACVLYGRAGAHEVGKALRVVGHMAKDGQVVLANDQVRLA